MTSFPVFEMIMTWVQEIVHSIYSILRKKKTIVNEYGAYDGISALVGLSVH